MKFPSLRVSLLLVTVFLALWVLLPSQGKAQVTDAKNNVSVETIAGDSVSQKIADSLHTTWPWYLTRGTGLVAAISLVILMLSGIGQITGHTYKFLEPLTAWASHRALGLVFGASVLVHVVSLLFDRFLKFSVLDILVPWWSKFKPVTLFGFKLGSLYLALGILAFYLSILIVVTSIVWVSKKAHLWKLIHLFSYVLIVMVFFHALNTGTDLAQGWPKLVWLASGVAVAYSSIVRLWRAYTA